MSRVLIVEDEQHLADGLRFNLEAEGYDVDVADSGEAAQEMLKGVSPDVIVLDVMLPGKDGFAVMSEMREAGQFVPTLMLTARGHPDDVLKGFAAGADDYLTKPFALDVLLARMRALARRGPATYPDDLQFEDVTLNRRTHELQRGDRRVALTRTEYSLLEVLMRRAGSIAPREVLAEAGWGGADVSDSTLYVFIRTLRGKIAAPGERQFLHTVRGIGYTLRTEAP